MNTIKRPIRETKEEFLARQETIHFQEISECVNGFYVSVNLGIDGYVYLNRSSEIDRNAAVAYFETKEDTQVAIDNYNFINDIAFLINI